MDELLATSRVARLATSDQYAKPHVVPIDFVWRQGVLYAPLDGEPQGDDDWHAPRLARNIETNGRVSIVVDRWEEDPSGQPWILLDGLATILEAGAERDEAAALLARKYPRYQRLPLDGRPLIRVAVEQITRGARS